MPFVLDASIATCWAFDDEDHPLAALALDRIRSDEAIAPSLWWFEVHNTLIVSERHGRLTEADTTAFLRELSRFRVVIDHVPDEATIMTIARQHRLSAYDASYLELAQRRAIPLTTMDYDLRKAATAHDIALVGAEA